MTEEDIKREIDEKVTAALHSIWDKKPQEFDPHFNPEDAAARIDPTGDDKRLAHFESDWKRRQEEIAEVKANSAEIHQKSNLPTKKPSALKKWLIAIGAALGSLLIFFGAKNATTQQAEKTPISDSSEQKNAPGINPNMESYMEQHRDEIEAGTAQRRKQQREELEKQREAVLEKYNQLLKVYNQYEDKPESEFTDEEAKTYRDALTGIYEMAEEELPNANSRVLADSIEQSLDLQPGSVTISYMAGPSPVVKVDAGIFTKTNDELSKDVIKQIVTLRKMIPFVQDSNGNYISTALLSNKELKKQVAKIADAQTEALELGAKYRDGGSITQTKGGRIAFEEAEKDR